MRNKILLTLLVCVCASVAWAADTSYEEKFSKIGNLSNGTSAVYGDLCTWQRTRASHRAQDTIAVKTRRAFLLPIAYAGASKLETTDWEGGIKKVDFKFGRFGNENTAGRVLQLNVKAGTTENSTATYAKNAMKQCTQGGTTYETYSYTFNCKEEDAQLVIDNISTHNESLTESSSICRILVADIVVTPYILYLQKEATIGTKQQGYVNEEFLDNSGGETLTYSSSNTSIATVDAATGVVTPVSAGDVQIYAALAEGARTHYTLHVVNNIVAENFSKVVQTGSASGATWDGDLFDWTANAARRGTNDTIKGRPIDRQQATWFSSEGYVESTEAVEGGIKNISFTWRQWSAKAASTTTKVAVSYGGVVKAYQEFSELSANVNKSFNEDITGGDKNAVLRISNLSYNAGGTVNNRIVIENVKITPWLLYTNKTEQRMRVGDTYKRVPDIDNTGGESGTLEYISSDDDIATVASDGTVTAKAVGKVTITAKYKWTESEYITTTYPVQIWPVNCETFDEITQTGNYNNTTPRVGDKATWTTSLGGFNVGDFSAYTINLARFRAPHQGSAEEAYIESSYISGGISSLSFKWNVGGSESTTNWDIRVLINGRQVKQLLTADLTDDILADFGTVSINDIDEPGKFNIRFENHSTVSGIYTSGNKGRFVIDDISWTSYDGPIELDETADNSAILSRNDGVKLDVDINRSNLVGGVYNTLCLPFSISKSDLGEGVDVQELTSASLDGDVLTVGFSALVGETLTAGTPYLVKPASNVSLTSFTDKTLISMPSTINQGAISLVGIFSPYAMTGGDKTTLFVGTPDGEGNNLFYPAADGSLKGFRAYFKLNTAMSSHSTPRVARFVVNQNRMPTGIEDVNGEGTRGEWKKVIRNGQLYIEHDGSVYTVTGQKAE